MFGMSLGIPVWSQVDNGTGTANDQTDDTQMQTPPVVSGTAYSTAVGNEVRSNYLRVGLGFSGGYIDNLFAGESASPLSETTWSIEPTISLDQTTPRQHRSFTYSPGFTFYQPTSELNQTTHSASFQYSLRLTPHTSMTLTDGFLDGSTVTGSAFLRVGGTVSGSSQSATPGIVPPFAQSISNAATGEFSVQTDRRAMIGITGMATILQYPNQREVAGLYNSSSRGGSAFYNRRISGAQFMGVTYQYSDFLTYPVNAASETQTHTLTFFYTLNPTERLSLSVSGGPQRYESAQAPLPSFGGWGPSLAASMGWQAQRTSFAASYSRQVSGGGGVLGVFESTVASGSVRQQLFRRWTAGVDANYSILKTVTPALLTDEQGGHGISGSATLEHELSQRLNITFDYDRIQEAYSGVTSIETNPDSDRETLSLSWHFSRPLGR